MSRRAVPVSPAVFAAVAALAVFAAATAGAAPDGGRYRTDTPDPRAASVPGALSARVFADPERTLPELVAFLAADSDDPFLTVRRIHDWIALNITYDLSVPPGGRPPAQLWPSVLADRKGVCSGYANLFAEMAKRAGFDCAAVSGYARGIDSDLFTEGERMIDDHAWNVVTIAGERYFADCTWDAGRVTQDGYTAAYSTAFLFTPPEEMIYSHLPSDDTLQLLPKPLSRKEFLALPVLRSDFFSLGLTPMRGIERMNTADDRFSFTMPVPDGVLLTAALFEHGGIEMKNRANVRAEDGDATVTVLFPRRGEFVLRLFARRADSPKKAYSLCAEFGFFAADGAPERFPVLSNAFADHGCVIHSPLTSPLKTGDPVRFKITAPGAKTVGVVIRGALVPFDRARGDTFEKTITVPLARDLVIGADFDGSGKLSGIAKFEMGK